MSVVPRDRRIAAAAIQCAAGMNPSSPEIAPAAQCPCGPARSDDRMDSSPPVHLYRSKPMAQRAGRLIVGLVTVCLTATGLYLDSVPVSAQAPRAAASNAGLPPI